MAATDDPSGDLVVTGSVVVPAAAQNWRFSRSSGPGGQGVNTADSRVELSVAPLELPGLSEHQQQRLAARLGGRLVDGVLTIAASEHRQQLRNRQAARERLAAVLRAALAPPPPSRRRTKPTRGSQERRIEAKKQRGQLKKQRRTWDDPADRCHHAACVHHPSRHLTSPGEHRAPPASRRGRTLPGARRPCSGRSRNWPSAA